MVEGPWFCHRCSQVAEVSMGLPFHWQISGKGKATKTTTNTEMYFMASI